MEQTPTEHFTTPEKVRVVLQHLVDVLAPEKVILFSQKTDLQGNVSSFKLCVVVETEDKEQIELDVYLAIDSPVSFDVLVYTPSEWQMLSQQPNSFAHRVLETGVILYER